MNREKYLKQLKFALEGLPEDEVQDILYDYEEHFAIGLSKGKSEEEISMELGDPGEVANNYKGASNHSHTDHSHSSTSDNHEDSLNFSKETPRKPLTRKTISILVGVALIALGSSLFYLNVNRSYRNRGLISINSGNESVKMNGKGIEVKDGNNYVSIGWDGIKVTDGEENVSIGWNGIRVNGKDVSDITSNNNISWNMGSKDLISQTIDEEKLESIDGISSISVASSFVDIKMIPQERDDVRVHYHGNIVSNVVPVLNVNKTSTNLEIKLEMPKNTSTTVQESNLVLEVFVPTTFSGKYNVVTASGDMEIANLSGDHFNITSSSGDVGLKNIHSPSSNITTSSGDIHLRNPMGYLSIRSSSGDIELDIEDPSGNMDLSTSSGDISFKLSDKSNYTVNGVTSSGSFQSNLPMTITENQNRKFKGVIGSGEKEIKITTSSGDVRFNRK